jgi:RHS repeat-associated protein
VWYDYSAFGALLRRKTNGTVDRHFLWDKGQLALEVDGAGTSKIAEYAYSGTDEPLAVWEGTNSAPYFYSHDQRRDVTGLTNGSLVLESRHFSPWGSEEFGVSIPENSKFGWKGLPWEGGIANLYYVQRRWYDPASRGFVSEDPIGLAGGLNSYAYSDNDPVNGWDPSGLSKDCHTYHVRGTTVTVFGIGGGPSVVTTTPGYTVTICEETRGGGNEGGDAPAGNQGGGQTNTDNTQAKPKSCSAARQAAYDLGEGLEHTATLMTFGGIGMVGASGLAAIFAPEGLPAELEVGSSGVALIKSAGVVSALAAGLKAFSNEENPIDGIERGVARAGESIALDAAAGAAGDLLPEGFGGVDSENVKEALSALVGKDAVEPLYNRISNAIRGEKNACASE